MTREEMLAKFKAWADTQNEADDLSADLDWKALSFGFFVALGASQELAYDLSTEARYTHHYWKA